MRIITSSKFTKVFLFKLISLVRCPKSVPIIYMQCNVLFDAVKGILFYEEGHILPLQQWLLEIPKDLREEKLS